MGLILVCEQRKYRWTGLYIDTVLTPAQREKLFSAVDSTKGITVLCDEIGLAVCRTIADRDINVEISQNAQFTPESVEDLARRVSYPSRVTIACHDAFVPSYPDGKCCSK